VKSRPSAQSTIARISGSASSSLNASRISVKNSGAMALSLSGLSSTTSAMGPSRSMRIAVNLVLMFLPRLIVFRKSGMPGG